MSHSARRIASDVSTGRFAWQGNVPRPSTSRAPQPLVPTGPVGLAPAPQAARDMTPPAPSIEAIEQAAYERGRADAEAEAAAAAAAQVESALEGVAATAAALSSLRATVLRRSERDLVRLALGIAERVLHRSVDVDRELLLVMARVALDRLGDQVVATVHLNPIDHDAATVRHRPDLGRSVELVADPAVPRGGCLVRSQAGTIDTGIDAQIGELSLALLGEGTEAEGADDAAATH